MKNKFNKIVIILFIIVFLSLANINVKAQTYRIVTLFPNTTNLKVGYTRKSYKQSKTSIASSYQSDRTFSGIGIYGITLGNYVKNVVEVYCSEPGSDLITLGKTGNKDDNYNEVTLLEYANKNRYLKNLSKDEKEARLKKINAIFTFAQKPVIGFGSDSKKFDEHYSNTIYATQLLIWEIIDGERTSFSKVRPDGTIKNSAYCKMFGCSDLSTTQVTSLSKVDSKYGISVASEYKRIVESVKAIFGNDAQKQRNKIGSFKVGTETSPVKHVMQYNSSSKQYELTIKDDYANYFKVRNAGSVQVSYPDTKTIKLVSKKNITSQVLEFYVSGNTNLLYLAEADTDTKYPYGKAFVDTAGYRQDLIAPEPKTYSVFIEVSTPNYALEVLKTDENNNPLKDAEFQLYDPDQKPISDGLLKTDDAGKASYNQIKNPGTYYIKEIKAAPTYNIKDGLLNGKALNAINYKDLHPITVAEGNTASNPLRITAVNKPNEIDLIKYTIDEETGEKTKSTTCDDSEPVFQVLDDSGDVVCFKKAPNTVRGTYTYANCSESEVVNEIQTCNGEFTVTYMPGCEDGKTAKRYIITELRAGGATIKDRSKTINMCDTDRSVSFYNGLTGLEFQKKDENGNLLDGGKFKLQKNENGVFLDKPVKKTGDGSYKYDESSTNFEIKTTSGTAIINGLQTGKYRVVEISPPNGYKKVDDSKAPEVTFGDSDSFKTIEMIDGKESIRGDKATAKLYLTITTGRKIIPYGLVIGGLIIGLIALIIIRNKNKK